MLTRYSLDKISVEQIFLWWTMRERFTTNSAFKPVITYHKCTNRRTSAVSTWFGQQHVNTVHHETLIATTDSVMWCEDVGDWIMWIQLPDIMAFWKKNWKIVRVSGHLRQFLKARTIENIHIETVPTDRTKMLGKNNHHLKYDCNQTLLVCSERLSWFIQSLKCRVRNLPNTQHGRGWVPQGPRWPLVWNTALKAMKQPKFHIESAQEVLRTTFHWRRCFQ